MVLAISIGQVLALSGTVAGLMVIFGGAYAVLRSTLSSTTNSLWEKNNQALEARVKILEDSEEACRQKLSHIEATNKILADQVSGASAIATLTAKIDQHHQDVMGLLGGSRKSERE